MKAISIRQPWAWLIVHGHKSVENRTWMYSHRGPILIHAAKGMTIDEYEDATYFALSIDASIPMPAPDEIERGGIVGIADMVDCVRRHPSRWFVGPAGLVLANQRALPFHPCRGALGIFDIDYQDPHP